jgi:spore maturation protein SpmA
VISLRAAAGSKNPSETIVATMLATAASMIVAIAVSRMFARWYALRARGGAA